MEILTFIRLFNENKKNIKIIQIPSKTSFFPASLYTLYTILYLYPYTPLYTPIYPPKPYSSFGTPYGILYNTPNLGRVSGCTVQYPQFGTRIRTPCTPPPKYGTLINSSFGTRIGKPNLGRVSGPPIWDAIRDANLGRHSGRHSGRQVGTRIRILYNTP